MLKAPPESEYQERAEEIRTCAENMKDQGARETMLRLAESYDRMAARETASGAAGQLRITRNI